MNIHHEQVRHDDETLALGELQQRLADRFPQLSPEVVEAAVRMAHAELRGPIRDFVPVLVERAARERLAAITPEPAAPSLTLMLT